MATDSNGLQILLVQAQLDEQSTTKVINEQLLRIQAKLNPITLKIDGLDPKVLTNFNDQVKSAGEQINKSLNGNVWIDQFGGNIKNAITKLQTMAKQGVISLDELQNKLLQVKDVYGQSGAFNGNFGIANEKAITDALLQAEKQRTAVLQQEQTNRANLEKLSQAEMDALHAQALKEYQAFLKQEESLDKAHFQASQQNQKMEQQAYADAIDAEMKQIKAFYDMKQVSAQETLQKVEQLMSQETQYFIDNQDKRLQALKIANAAETEINAQASKSASITSKSTSHGNNNIIGSGLLGTAEMMASFAGVATLFETMKQGIVDLDTASAGLKQVFGEDVQSQQQLNDVTNQFIGIAKEYGTSVQDVMDAGKLWGRQYKDLEVAQTLTNNSTLLSIVDNLKVVDANKAVESSMNALNMSVNNNAQAMQSSMKLVDSWSAVSHGASVSASDLTQGFERSAAAARQAGVSVDQLNALVAAGVRNSGRNGSVIGNTLKSVFDNITSESPKVVDAFNNLGISMTTVDSSGQTHLKPVYDLLLELSKSAQNATPEMNKYYSAIAGGKYQFDSLLATITNTKSITDAYNISVNSAGSASKLAADQMHTMQAELNRLKDAIQQIAFNTNNNGLGSFLKEIVTLAADFVNGLSKVPSSVYVVGTALAGLTLAGKMLSSTMTTIKNTVDTAKNSFALLSNPIEFLANIFPKEIALTNEKTVALAKLTAVIEENTAAEEQQVAKAALTTLGLGAEAAAANTATSAFARLDVASAGLTVAVGLIITGLVGAVGWLGSASDSANTFAQSIQSNVTTLQQQKQSLQDLSTEYQNLKAKTDQTSADKQRLAQIEQDLVDKYGVSVTGINAEGKAYSDSTTAINNRISAMQKEIDIQEQLNKVKLQESDASNNKTIQDESTAVQRDTKSLQLQQQAIEEGIKKGTSPDDLKLMQNSADILESWLTNDNKKLQDAINQRQQVLTDSINKYIATQQTNGKNISDAEQGFAGTLVNAISRDGQSIDQQINSLQQIFQKLQSSNYDQLVQQYQKDLAAFSQDRSSSNASVLNDDSQAIQKLVESLVSGLIPQTQQGIIATQNLKDALNQTYGDSSVAKIQQTSQATFDLDTFEQNLGKTFSTTEKAIEPLNNAIDTLNKGHQLSATTIKDLINQYPQLFEMTTEENGQLQLNAGALTTVRNAQIDLMNTSLAGDQNSLASLEQTTVAKLNQWGIQIKAIQSVADAENAANQLTQKTIQDRQNSGMLAPSQVYGSVPTDVQQTLNNIDAIGKAYDSLNSLKDKVNATGGDFVDTTNTPNTSSSAGIPSPASVASADTKQVLDANTVAMDGWNAKLKESQAIQAGLNKTSAEYISLQKDQITYYQNMQDVLHNEADGLREVNDQLQQQIDNGGLNEKQQQQLQLQIDSNNAKIAGYSATWFTYQKNIADIQAQMSDNKVTDAINNAKAAIDPYDQKIKDLTHSMSLMLDGDNAKVEKQGELISLYESEDEQLQKNIDSYTQLASTLDKNSTAFATLQQEITSAQDKLASNQTAIYNARVTAAQNEVNFVKKAYQDELNARLAVIDAEKKAIDDQATQYEDAIQREIDALDRQSQAADYNKSLEKEQDNAQKIQNQINALMLDNSQEANSKRIDLEQQLADEKEKIADMQNKHSIDLQKQSLQDEDKAYKQDVTNKKNALDDQKTALQEHYQSIINDDQHWLQVEQDMVNGNVTSIQNDLKGLSDDLSQFIKDNANKVGLDIQAQMTTINNLIEQTKQHAQTVSTNIGISQSSGSQSGQSNQGSGGTSSNPYMNADGSASMASIQNFLYDFGNQWSQAKDDATRGKIHDYVSTVMTRMGATYDDKSGYWSLNGKPIIPAKMNSYDIGGYTGTFSGGQPAIVHSQELILNKEDTLNILKSVGMVRQFANIIKPFIPTNFGMNNSKPANNINLYYSVGTIQGTQEDSNKFYSILKNDLTKLGVLN